MQVQHTVQLSANLTPAGKQPTRFGFLPAPVGACTGTHAHYKLPVTSYQLQVISTTDKNTSLSSLILHASHYTHTLSSPSQIFHEPFHFAY